MAKSYIERGQTAVEAVISAIFNELEVSPDAVPEDIFIVLAHQIAVLCAALAHPSSGQLRCPSCGNDDLDTISATDDIARVWRELRMDDGVLVASFDELVPEACSETRLLCDACDTEFPVPAGLGLDCRSPPPVAVASVPVGRTP